MLALVASTAFGQATTFSLGFDGASQVSGNTGDAWSGSYSATLDSSGGGSGAQGWSISMSSDNASISGVTTAGSDVDAL